MTRHRPIRTTTCWAALAPVLLASVPALAGEPPTQPILTVDVGMHVASIRASALDPAERFVVTGSADKTVRLWELPSLRLRRTFYLPVGMGPEGRVHDLAVSRDGQTLAVGGWTGWEWDQAGAVYFYDIRTGRMIGVLSGLPQAIGSLAYSPDGRSLVVGLMGAEGLMAFRTSDYGMAAQDSDYADRIVSVDFARDGRLAVSSFDGRIRVYDRKLSLVSSTKLAGGETPLEVRFSPDGKRLAVGYHGSARVDVLDARTLELVHSPVVPSTGWKDLYVVAWSRDGRTLYAGGTGSKPGANAILSWSDGGRGGAAVIPAARARMGRILPLGDGSVYYGSEDPEIGLFDRTGRILSRRRTPSADFQELGQALKLSTDGMTVEFRPGSNDDRTVHFSLADRQLAFENAPGPVHPPLQRKAGTQVEVSEDGFSVRVNGQPVPLEPFERVRHFCLSPDGKTVVFATEWALRAVDLQGTPLWTVPLPVVAHAANVSADGRYVVAAVSDGTLRWYRTQDGAPVLSFFLNVEAMEWIAWLPSGLYDASPNGDQFIGWLLNRGRDREPIFFSAVQFDRALYKPDRVRQLVGSKAPEPAREFDANSLLSMAPPSIAIDIAQEVAPMLTGPVATVQFGVQQGAAPMLSYTVFVNKIPITTYDERQLQGAEQQVFQRSVEVPLLGELNEIRVEVESERSRGIASVVASNTGRVVEQQQGKLIVLAVGVSALRFMPEDSLDYAAKDAERIAALLRSQGTRSFRGVEVHLIADGRDEGPTKAAIERTLQVLRNTNAADTTVLYLAGHGLSDASGNYYLVPSDARPEDVEAVNADRPTAPSLVRWDSLVEALRASAGRRVLMVDTCHARQITGQLDLSWLAKNSASSLFALMAAAAPNEESEEASEFGAGLFTQGVIEALEGSGDLDGDGRVSVSEAHRSAARFVEQHRVGQQAPQYVAPTELSSTILADLRGADR